MWVVPPEQVYIYIKVYIYETLTYAQIDSIKDAVCSLASNLTIGQTVTSKMITDVVTAACPDLTVQGADVSKNGTTYSFNAMPNSDEVFIFSLDNISVVEVTE